MKGEYHEIKCDSCYRCLDSKFDSYESWFFIMQQDGACNNLSDELFEFPKCGDFVFS